MEMKNINIDEILDFHQYSLKLHFKYFFLSEINLIWLIISYLTFSDFFNFMIFYLGGCILLYKFIFSKTRGSNPFLIFVLNKISNGLFKIRNFKKELRK